MTTPEHPAAGFPTTRLRRLRYSPAVRRLVQETALQPANLVLPLFVRSGQNVRQPIAALPGHFQLSPDQAAEEVRQAADLGLGGVILFGIPDRKDPLGSDSYNERGIIQRAIEAAKRRRRRAGDHRRLFLRIHRSRPLRRADENGRPDRRRQRRHAGASGPAGGQPCPGRGRHGRAQRHDGRHGGRDPGGPGRGRLPARADHELRGQVCQRVLRPVPRRGRKHAGEGDRRSYQMDPAAGAGPGPARDRARPGRRGRHDHGQAGPGLSRHHPPAASVFPACRWRPTTFRASSAWSRPRRPEAGSTSVPRPKRC